MPSRLEVAGAALEPYVDATRDVFANFEPEPGFRLSLVEKTKVVCDEGVRDSERHYAACRDDGLLILVAPEAAEQLDVESLQAVLAHEFGHAADFLYPGRFLGRRGQPARWVPSGARKMDKARRLWSERSESQVEMDADSIARLVTGVQIRYCGPCLVQCFDPKGKLRPESLR